MDFDFTLRKYDVAKDWIRSAREHKKTYEFIDLGGKKDESELLEFLGRQRDENFWDISLEEWHACVAWYKNFESNQKIGLIHEPAKGEREAPKEPLSCWQLYKRKLTEKGFTAASIQSIESATQKVVGQISEHTPQTDPVRGLVVGNVQSGKTANMAAVIAMAADYGFNFFVVLSGTIENLRKQTRDRLLGDLNHNQQILSFEYLEQLSGTTQSPFRLQDLKLNGQSTHRYLCVCLKYASRLNDLLVWLNSDPNQKKNLKILVLDDEADQAGINTADINSAEKTAINKALVHLAFAKTKAGIDGTPYGAMNYIAYTATPYGNLLNEARDKSLYPKNFILTLPTPAEYIGPQQIFGLLGESDGLPIVNTISPDEIVTIGHGVSTPKEPIPSGLKEALIWFVCALATFRFWGKKKPISMLIHTSQRTFKHQEMSEAISKFFTDFKKTDYLSFVQSVWVKQTSKLSKDVFNEMMPDYFEGEKIKDYPSFKEIEPFIVMIIENGLTHIKLADDEQLTYSENVHLCVDNCSSNYTDGDTVLRIVYPDEKRLETLSCAPGFIVIGGNTLSRGLTLEGLVCTYFLRTTKLADTLMQMGRWFGYRRGYELLPRLWLSKRANDQYVRLSALDYNLRHEILVMQDRGLSPKEYAPRLDSFPDYKELVTTSKRKSQSAITVSVTYANKSGQTTKFYNDPAIIQSNFDEAKNFVNSLGPVDEQAIKDLNNPNITAKSPAYVWLDQEYENIIGFLKKLKYPKQAATLGDLDAIEKWFKTEHDEGHLKNWNVILSTVNKKGTNTLSFKNLTIGMPTRAKLNYPSDPDTIYLKTITAPHDYLLDIDSNLLDAQELEALRDTSLVKGLSIAEKRILFKKADTPLLVLYFIDKESGADDPRYIGNESIEGARLPLNTPQHLFGYYVYIPYGTLDDGSVQITSSNKISVKLEFTNELEADIDEDEN